MGYGVNSEIITYLCFMARKQTLEEVNNNPASHVKLKCIKPYNGSYNVGPGQITFFNYKKGEVHKRREIFLIEGYWELYNEKK
jgi:hypothetical protein